MSLFPGYNEEGAGRQFAEALLQAERDLANAPPVPEDVVLLQKLSRALDTDVIHAKLVALHACAKCIRDGSVTRADLAALRERR